MRRIGSLYAPPMRFARAVTASLRQGDGRFHGCSRRFTATAPGAALASCSMKRILLATLVVGALDITEIMVFLGIRGIAPIRILQSVAAGLVGRSAAYAGGIPTALLGLALHFFIAGVVVCVYFFGSRKIVALREAPIIMGAVYGLLVYLFMNLVVLPLSAVGPPKFTLTGVLNQLFAHVFCIGIPTALFARSAHLTSLRHGGDS